MALYKISSSRVNNINAQDYAGSVVEEGLIWYDPEQGTLRLYNGEPGGRIINGGGGGSGSELVNGSSNVRVYPNGPVAISVNGIANVAVFEGPRAEFDSVVSQGTLAVGGTTTVKDILPSADDTYDLGSPDQKFRSLYVGGNTIYIGNEQLKVSPDSGTWTFTSNGANVVLGADVAFNPPEIATTGNVTANYFIGDGSRLTGITAQMPGVFGLVIDGGDAAVASSDFVIDAGGA
jgi:hypothetical protein